MLHFKCIESFYKVSSFLSVFQLSQIENELEVRCMYHTTVTGADLLQISPELLHPHVSYLMKKKSQLQEKIQRLEQEIAYRPQPPQVKINCKRLN